MLKSWLNKKYLMMQINIVLSENICISFKPIIMKLLYSTILFIYLSSYGYYKHELKFNIFGLLDFFSNSEEKDIYE